MEELERKILTRLLDRYEKYRKSNDLQTRQRPLRIKVTDGVFDKYRNNEDGALGLALGRIEKEGFAVIHRTQGYFDYLDLNLDPDSVEKLYSYLGRSNPEDEIEIYERILQTIKPEDGDIAYSFAKEMIHRLDEGKLANVQTYFASADELKDICTGIGAMEKLDKEIPERIFSVKTYSDSKRFASIRPHIERIIREFSSEPFDKDDDPIAAMGVIKNTTLAAIKGNVVLKVGEQTIDLSTLGQPLFLTDESILGMEVVDILPAKLMTVENLTTFLVMSDEAYAYIYLGGFHNAVRRNLILKMKEAKPSLAFYHYGDIDAGGFYILNHLRQKTGIAFSPYHMGIEELKRYKDSSKPLTQNDEKRLTKMLSDERFLEFKETIEYIISSNEKLEQEAEDDITA